MKKVLLFDLDDTLLDFKAAEAYGLEKVFTRYGVPYTPAKIANYQTINHKLWQQYEAGKIPREGITGERFPRFFAAEGIDANGLLAEDAYRTYLGEAKKEVPGARALLTQLQADYELCLVTNGVAQTQKARLANTGFGAFFSHVFISEELACQKPDPRFFQQVVAALPHYQKAEMLVIGDSLTSDIQGGQDSQIETVWFNPRREKATIAPTFEIHALKDLPNLLQKIS